MRLARSRLWAGHVPALCRGGPHWASHERGGHCMEWTVHGRRAIYESSWLSLYLVDIELPDGQRFEQHVVRMARPVAAVVVVDERERVLLMWRHRHVTDTWGWEIPAGRVEEGESIEEAAARETEEETGWRPRSLRLMVAS